MSKCRNLGLGLKTCLRCGKPYQPKDDRPNRPARYCSRSCAQPNRKKRVLLTCRQCGKEFERKAYMKTWSAERGPFCSMGCYARWQSTHLIGKNRKRKRVNCYICGKTIEKQPSAVVDHNFCSRQCFAAWRASPAWSGSKNPAWLGGHEAYRGPNWNRQTRAARRRDDDTCQRCGTRGPDLPVHHVRPFRLFADYRKANLLSNLRTLCPRCHGLEEIEFWRRHPELADKAPFPIVVPIATCSSCGEEFVPRSGAARVCDACCTVTCAKCGKVFRSRRNAFRNVKYCSRQCRNAHIAREPQKCPGCGKTFLPTRTSVIYCSSQCHLMNANPRRHYFTKKRGQVPK